MIDLPQIFHFDEKVHESEAAALAEILAKLDLGLPFVLASPHGNALASELDGGPAPESPAEGADQTWAAELGSRAHRSGADSIVAIGGGRCLDIGKLAAARAGLVLVAVPTQLSHDGICSPVAVVPNREGISESLGAIAPRAVFLSMPTLVGAPWESVAAGIGDLLANPYALRDWALAADRGLTEIDARAWELSAEATDEIDPYLDRGAVELAADTEFLRTLADALVLSGTAMIRAGTSRPASGGEHEISHAIDKLYGGRALHGAQVALGTIVSAALYEEDVPAARQRLRAIGLPDEPRALGLSDDEMVEVLLEAPDTRPGRFTILEHADLSPDEALKLVRSIWPGQD